MVQAKMKIALVVPVILNVFVVVEFVVVVTGWDCEWFYLKDSPLFILNEEGPIGHLLV